MSGADDSIPAASAKGAHSSHYECEFFGIINRKGEIWTPLIFGSRKEAEAYRDETAAKWGGKFADIPRTHKIVPIEFRIEPAIAEARGEA